MVTYYCGVDRKKQTQKKIFTDFVRSCVIPIKSLTVNTIIFYRLPINHFKRSFNPKAE